MDPSLSPRLLRRVRADFGRRTDEVTALLETAESGNQDRERVLAAIVLGARGDAANVRHLAELSEVDWRDVLVNGGLASGDWAARLDEQLGPHAPSDEVRRAYGELAATYIDFFGGTLGMRDDDLALLERHLSNLSGIVLDAGCGPGHLTDHLRGHGVDTFGVDVTPEFVEHARGTYPSTPYVLGSIERLPVADGSVDGVLAWYSLIHVPQTELDAALAELRRVTASGGSLVVGFFAGDEHRAFAHKVTTAYYWPANEFSGRLARAGFAEVERVDRPGVDESGQRPHAAIAAIAD